MCQAWKQRKIEKFSEMMEILKEGRTWERVEILTFILILKLCKVAKEVQKKDFEGDLKEG